MHRRRFGLYDLLFTTSRPVKLPLRAILPGLRLQKQTFVYPLMSVTVMNRSTDLHHRIYYYFAILLSSPRSLLDENYRAEPIYAIEYHHPTIIIGAYRCITLLRTEYTKKLFSSRSWVIWFLEEYVL